MYDRHKEIEGIAQEIVLELLVERCPNSNTKVTDQMLEFVSKVKLEDPSDKRKVRKALRKAGKEWLKERGLWITKERDRLAPLGLHNSAKDDSADVNPESNDDQTSQQLSELAQECADECGAFGMTESAAIRRERERARDAFENLLEQTSPERRSKLSKILEQGPGSLRETAEEIGLKHPEEARRFFKAVAKDSLPKLRIEAPNSPKLNKPRLASSYDPPVVSKDVILSTPGAPCLTYWKDLRTSASRRKRTLRVKLAPGIYDLSVPRRARKVTHRQFGDGVVLQKRDTDSGKALVILFNDGSRRIILCEEGDSDGSQPGGGLAS